ncbi:MAG: acyl-CoA thioesterase [Williamsia sp.]|nr:acyl-CoA thioesterase [Williamsia sp.]
MPMIRSEGNSYYEYKFIATFEETNVVGNVYFANYVLWQGKCREMFLYEYCPEIVEDINGGLYLITLDLSVQYISQLHAFDKVVMHMSLEAQGESRLMMNFDYYHQKGDKLILVCKGHQATAAMRMRDGQLVPAHFPESMLEVFQEYA